MNNYQFRFHLETFHQGMIEENWKLVNALQKLLMPNYLLEWSYQVHFWVFPQRSNLLYENSYNYRPFNFSKWAEINEFSYQANRKSAASEINR